MALKGFPPTLRQKTRYILCKIDGCTDIDAVEHAVQNAVLHYVGVKGAGQAGVYVVRSHSSLPYVVVRCTAQSKDDVLKSLLYVQGHSISVETLLTTGSLHKATVESARAPNNATTKHKVKLCKVQTIIN